MQVDSLRLLMVISSRVFYAVDSLRQLSGAEATVAGIRVVERSRNTPFVPEQFAG